MEMTTFSPPMAVEKLAKFLRKPVLFCYQGGIFDDLWVILDCEVSGWDLPPAHLNFRVAQSTMGDASIAKSIKKCENRLIVNLNYNRNVVKEISAMWKSPLQIITSQIEVDVETSAIFKKLLNFYLN